MVIGKGGNYIKQIKEDSGSYVQLSQKAKDQILQERCITVIGKLKYLFGTADSHVCALAEFSSSERLYKCYLSVQITRQY